MDSLPVGTLRSGGVELAGMLADLARTAGTDDTWPAFTVIRLHTEGGVLHGWSTNRFIAGHATIEVRGSLAGPILIHRADALLIAKMMAKMVTTTLTVTNKGTVTVDGIGRDGEQTITCRRPEDGLLDLMPNVARGCTDTLPVASVPQRFDPAYLAEFAAIAKRRKVKLDLHTGDTRNQPSHVRIGGRYRAWIMPTLEVVSGESLDDLSWLPNAW
jgi:hypothetical protein